MSKKVLVFISLLYAFSLSASAQVLKIITLGGNGIIGFSGDGSGAPAAEFDGPLDVAVDNAGNVYVCDVYNYRIRKISTSGIITTVAGNGSVGYTGNGSIASSAEIGPSGVAADSKYNLYISDRYHAVIRKVNASGIISTCAGNGLQGYSGDSSSATVARLRVPLGLAVDKKGNLFIADAGNHVVRRVDTLGKITTYAGMGVPGYFGDGGNAMLAALDSPVAVAVDRLENLYIVDYFNNVIRKVDANQVITTFAGTGAHGASGDGNLATLATLNNPKGVAVDTNLNVYISDGDNNVIRQVDASGNITTVVGNGTAGFGGDLGPALGANLNSPCGIAVDVYGSLYIADANNQRIRKTVSNTGVRNVYAVHVSVFPNPCINTIAIAGLSKSDKVKVYDISGRQVNDTWEAAGSALETYNIGNLAPGIYTLVVSDNVGAGKAAVQLAKE